MQDIYVSIKGHRKLTTATKKRAKAPRTAVRRAHSLRRRSPKAEAEILLLVRTGVRKFILEKATILDFLDGLREISTRTKGHPHQLTKAVFTKIVREAIRKRNARTTGHE
jgi:hypothetical protein